MPAQYPNVKMITCESFFKEKKNAVPEKNVVTLAYNLNNDTSAFPPPSICKSAHAHFSFSLTKY